MRNVYAGYGDQNVLRDVTLKIEPGRIYAVVGKNGCGKSTLLKTCAAILTPERGSICVNGRALAGFSPAERARILSYLSQSRNIPGISAARLVEHGRYPRLERPRRMGESDRAAVSLAIDRMHLRDICRKSMKQLSGGECQRAFIAMQLAQDAPLMLLDEPTTYMDIEHQLSLMSLLQTLRQTGKAIVMVLHDLPMALKYSDCIIAMENGCISSVAAPQATVESGILEKIFNICIKPAENGYILQEKDHPI